MINILKKIIDKKKDKIIFYKNEYKENKLLEDIKNAKNFINFKDKIKKKFFRKKKFQS